MMARTLERTGALREEWIVELVEQLEVPPQAPHLVVQMDLPLVA
jgi:hypothetical protein